MLEKFFPGYSRIFFGLNVTEITSGPRTQMTVTPIPPTKDTDVTVLAQNKCAIGDGKSVRVVLTGQTMARGRAMTIIDDSVNNRTEVQLPDRDLIFIGPGQMTPIVERGNLLARIFRRP